MQRGATSIIQATQNIQVRINKKDTLCAKWNTICHKCICNKLMWDPTWSIFNLQYAKEELIVLRKNKTDDPIVRAWMQKQQISSRSYLIISQI